MIRTNSNANKPPPPLCQRLFWSRWYLSLVPTYIYAYLSCVRKHTHMLIYISQKQSIARYTHIHLLCTRGSQTCRAQCSNKHKVRQMVFDFHYYIYNEHCAYASHSLFGWLKFSCICSMVWSVNFNLCALAFSDQFFSRCSYKKLFFL